MSIKININEIKFTIRKPTGFKKHPNLLANITLTLKEEFGEYLTISGFTLWKSKFEGYNLGVPSKPGFKFSLISTSLKGKIKKAIIEQYEYDSIPIIEEGNK